MIRRTGLLFSVAILHMLVQTAWLPQAAGAQSDSTKSRAKSTATRKSAAAPKADKPSAAATGRILVTVDGQPITEGDLEFLMLSRQVPAELRPTARKALLETLIDQQLVREHLKGLRAEPSTAQLDLQVAGIRQMIVRGGSNPDEVLSKLGYDEARLRRELSLPLSWRIHVQRTVAPEKLREYFDKNRSRFDGTQLRASQIFLKLNADATPQAEQAAKEKLDQLRKQIVAGTVAFGEAASKHSEAPSRDQGGDVGYFPYRGKMPEEIARIAFGLDVGAVSEPFRTSFGMHLVTVTDRKPGQLSLEDARPQVFEEISQRLWQETVRELRSKAKIEWKTPIE
jgi:hypothetical protein